VWILRESENALAHELRKRGHHVQQQFLLNVRYDAVVVGQYVADLVIDGDVLVEIKAIKCFEDVHLA
jgi:GxxExxY protein